MRLQPPAGDESNMDLVEIVAAEVQDRGPMTFARFMEIVVNHPEHGYYAASVERVGRSGDFLTAPETHYLFGWLVARQVAECWELLGRDPELMVTEYGAGRGTLGIQILDWFSRHPVEGLKSIRYRARDLNPTHQKRIERAIENEAGSVLSLSDADPGPFVGVALANELLDALPFHRLTVRDGIIQELFVTIRDGWFSEVAGELSEEAAGVPDPGVDLVEGQVFEFSPAIAVWIEGLARDLDRGFAIVLDYGAERATLLDAERFPDGTLKTYRQHQVGDDPFRDIGRRDITAHVDFSLVADAAAASGFWVEGVTSQAEFVSGLGLDEVLLEIQAGGNADDYARARAAAMELLNPGGLGRFKAAILSRYVGAGRILRGLSFRLPGLFRS